jgi:glycosyltransferase involved in cell wall biosynthesis
MKQLQILTVNFKSKKLIEKNIQLTRKLNANFPHYEWIIINNDPNEELDSLCSDQVRVYPGPKGFESHFDKGSYHHAAALNLGLKHINSRYLLIIDPDFFTLRTNWLKNLIDHMLDNDLSFFGSIWDPFNYMKYQNFPSVHFMLIDNKKVPIADLDFTPNTIKTQQMKSLFEFKTRIKIVKKLLKQISYFFLAEKSFDTGHKINQKFRHYKVECLKFAVYPEDLKYWEKLKKRVPKLFNTFLFKKIWKSEHHFHKVSGQRPGSEDEFWWQEKIFGIHLRRVRAQHSKKQLNEAGQCYEDQFIKRAEQIFKDQV